MGVVVVLQVINYKRINGMLLLFPPLGDNLEYSWELFVPGTFLKSKKAALKRCMSFWTEVIYLEPNTGAGQEWARFLVCVNKLW